MTAATGGILRSRPRYSHAANGDVESDAANSDSTPADTPATPRIDGNPSSAEKLVGKTTTIPTPTPSHRGAGGGNQMIIRSLADLVNSSMNLNAEASGVADSERANVVSHKLIAKKSPKEGENMSIIHISEKGTPYLKDPTTSHDTSGPEAVGVVGEDGQQVRFCEYDDDDNSGETNNDNTATSRDRLEQRIDIDYENDFVLDEEEKNENDSDGSSDCDEDILRELGLSELISDEDDAAEDDDEVEMEESGVHSNSEEFRSFRVLWELLTRWVTPSTIELVLNYQGQQGTQQPSTFASESSPSPESSPEEEKSDTGSRRRNEVDIGASRLASIMSMLKMGITRSMSELKKVQHSGAITDRRTVELRLADLVRTFDSSAPAANLNMKMWKGLTTILIAIAFPSGTGEACLSNDDDMLLPPSIRPLKLSVAEYRYLTQSAITSLSSAA
ncbi:hypothetical protein ACHAXR_004972 [Thalassiosira sp. AJA248-18]